MEAELSPLEWAERYGLWKLPMRPKPMHYRWMELAAEAIRTEGHLLIQAPKGFAKTHVIGFILPIWYLCCVNPNGRILFVGETITDADRRTAAIKAELESNEALAAKYGKNGTFKPSPSQANGSWADGEFVVAIRTNWSLKDASVRAVGTEGSLIGSRADLIITDDLISEENQATSRWRGKIARWFFRSLLGCLEPHGVAICIGTRKHYKDLYSELKETPRWTVPSDWERADYEDDHGVMRSHWPELWSDAKLAELRAANPRAYDLDRRNQPVSEEDNPIPWEWIKAACDRGRDLDLAPARDLGLKWVVQAWDVAGLTDPEGAAERDSDYYACVTGGIRGDGKLLLAGLWRGRGLSPQRWAEEVIIQYVRHAPNVVVVETNGVQQFFRSYAQTATRVPMKPFQTTDVEKLLLRTRTAGISMHLEQNLWVFPYKRNSKEMVDELGDELNGFEKASHDDLAMAMVMVDSTLAQRGKPGGAPRAEVQGTVQGG